VIDVHFKFSASLEPTGGAVEVVIFVGLLLFSILFFKLSRIVFSKRTPRWMSIVLKKFLQILTVLVGCITLFLVLSVLLLGFLKPMSMVPQPQPSAGSTPPQPTVTPNPAPSELINRALQKLLLGSSYHNVPEEMQVGVEEIIEAGIAPKVTPQIIRELQGKGKIDIKPEVRYDPAGSQMSLVVDPDEFKVREIKGGKQFVTDQVPGKWIWAVVPLKSGQHRIVVKASVLLKVPELNTENSNEFVVFQGERTVKVNWRYSTGEFVSTNWKEIIPPIAGSGSLAGLAGWWFAKRKKEKESVVNQPRKGKKSKQLLKKEK
jgi:hypothetical protein